ncbi:MAG: DNA translocase FtsK [Rhodanobacter sp.]
MRQSKEEPSIDGAEYPLLSKAIEIVRGKDSASISMLQRVLKIGYINASRLIECMFQQGVVSAPDRFGNRAVIHTSPS